MNKNGLTMTMVFLAESANYGEGIGNITALKKMTRGGYQQYTYISRQALRYNLIQQLNWDNTPVAVADAKKSVVQFAPSATIEKYPEIDLFGYMKTVSKNDEEKGSAFTRSAVVRLSNAIALEPYQGDMDYLTNMGLAKRENFQNTIAQSEIQRSYYSYTVCVDLERAGIDGKIEIASEEKADRIKVLLDGLQYLYRDIRGRRENLSPLFIIGGRYAKKNPFFENRIKIEKNKLNTCILEEILKGNNEIEENTYVGVTTDIFDNDWQIKEKLQAKTVGVVFQKLKEEVDMYYGESN